jgi:mannose-6-phosphate isomerase-like protein (cupin superfamily)
MRDDCCPQLVYNASQGRWNEWDPCDMTSDEPREGEILVVQPGEAPSFCQPVPANGFVEVVVAPSRVPMATPFGFGTQTVPPACHVREHRHDRNDEVIHVLDGHGRAVIDGADFPLRPGTTLFIGRNRLHMLINDSTADISWIWLLVPNGLADFFAAIGRLRSPGDAAPAPFARPVDVLEIERHAGFAPPPAAPRTR